MKKILAAIVVLAFAFIACSFMVESDAASSDVVIYEVKSAGTDGFSLRNIGSSDVDLKNYSLTDKEGTLTFNNSLILEKGQTITVTLNDDDASNKFINRYTTYLYGKNGIKADSKFALNDSGDDLYLLKGDKTIDAFCYGNVTITDSSLWTGDAYKKMSKAGNDFAVRISDAGGSAKAFQQWGITTNFFDENTAYDATITPFLFPNSGGIPIYKTLEKATKSVYITMYELTNANLYALLVDLENRGVDVTILLEKSPLGYSSLSSDAKKMKALIDAGGEIMFIGGDSDRYTYVHAKYCVVDDDIVIVTSENWVTDNLNGISVTNAEKGKGNRGWGAIIESKDYASFMMTVFNNDSNKTYGDVIDFDEYLTNVTATTLTYKAPTNTYTTYSYTGTVTPTMSPDSSWDSSLYYIDHATTRIYSQQQSITSSYANITVESPIKHMAAKADAGVDVRFILNAATDATTAQNQVDNINMTSNIKSATMSKPYVHNKGLICDDTVFVTSVNWTDTSFKNNREMGVIIHSKDVADFFANEFKTDFDKNYSYSGLTVSFTEISDKYSKPGEISFTVAVEQEGTFSYHWDLDGNTKDTTVPRTVFDVSSGDHTLKVTVSDLDGNEGFVTKTFNIGGSSSSDTDPDSGSTVDVNGIIDKIKPYIIPIIIIILGLLLALVKAASGGKKKSKKKGGKKR